LFASQDTSLTFNFSRFRYAWSA